VLREHCLAGELARRGNAGKQRIFRGEQARRLNGGEKCKRRAH
jgi:hypothetical protein